ncbi:hypothetical protein QQP08_009551 [Theobroma cacao]|nr:hypothetical protein QQP08_009551 [Theobroma cacao]
MYTTSWELGFS